MQASLIRRLQATTLCPFYGKIVDVETVASERVRHAGSEIADVVLRRRRRQANDAVDNYAATTEFHRRDTEKLLAEYSLECLAQLTARQRAGFQF